MLFSLGIKITVVASIIVSITIGSCSTIPTSKTTRANSDGDRYNSSTKAITLANCGYTLCSSSTTSAAVASTMNTSTRDKFLWPFSSNSTWNMPIGSGARYEPANIKQAYYAAADEAYFYKLRADSPRRALYAPGTWGSGRCTGTRYQGISLPLPDNLIVPDATNIATPNNPAAFLMPDGRTLVQVNPLTRCRRGGPVFGWRATNISIYEDGVLGGHGGSSLSSIGGTIRLGELAAREPIRHALKVNLWAVKYFYYSQSVPGYRWPASSADSYAVREYKGQNRNLVMGTLLAIPPRVTEASLGLQTPAARKLFQALQDYGAYVVDDTAWDAHAFVVEKGVLEEFRVTFGYNFSGAGGTFYDDFMKLFKSLHIVYNNEPNNIGGGGTRRAPLAPPIRN